MKKCTKCKQLKKINQFYKDCNWCIDCTKIYMRLYYKKNWNKLKQKRIINQKQIKITKKLYKINNRNKTNKYQSEYKKLNKNKYKIYRLNYFRKHKVQKIIRTLRIRLWKLISKNNHKNLMMNLIGCSIEQLQKHLQLKFTKGMSWKNYGKWHIDHIRPCCSFNLNKILEQKKCFHYKNLQPLWAEDNLKKGVKNGSSWKNSC